MQKIKITLVGIIFVFGVLFFMGRMSLILNPIHRKTYLKTYITELRTKKSIDPEAFWEFRDFYSLGSSSFSAVAIEKDGPFLTFDTSMIQSKDYLTVSGSLLPNRNMVPLGAEVIVQTDGELVYLHGNKLVIKFRKTIDEMKRVNGFFGYFGMDLEKYKDRQWYNETSITN